MTTPLAHMTAQLVTAPVEIAFAYLRDPVRLGRWSLGCFDTAATETPGLYTGRSLFDGGAGWFRIDADEAGRAIDYLVGTPQHLTRRISVRLMAGPDLGYAAGTCLVTLTAWRPADMNDERWARLCAAHEVEILLIKAQIEADMDTLPNNRNEQAGRR
jgi:hypothetical protein